MTDHEQPSLFEAHARRTDPDTSHAAARSVTGIRPSQVAVLKVLRQRLAGRGTDEQIAEAYANCSGVPLQSPSGLRTRRHELVERGLLADSGDRIRLRTGRMAIVWVAR